MAPRASVHAFARMGQGGFTYLGLIILVTVIGLVGAATLKIDSLLRRAAAEEELLNIGAEFSAALASYAAATPKGQMPQPPSLQELLRDPRTPALRRHLRKIFIDPVTGSAEWGIVYAGDRAGVVGVYSLSQATPFKIGNFDPRFVGFDNKEHLSDWKFPAGLPPTALPPATGMQSVPSLIPLAPLRMAESVVPASVTPSPTAAQEVVDEKVEAPPPAAEDEL